MMREFVINRADGSQRKVLGYKAAKPDSNVKTYHAKKKKLPAKVDLRSAMTAVENQGETMSCVANAVAGAYEYLAKMHTGDDYDVSRLFIYYNARLIDVGEGGRIRDDGSLIQSAIEGLKEYGACSEETYPFDEGRVNKKPNSDAYEEAAQFCVEDMMLVPTDLQAWKSCLAEGYPIVFGINLYQSFDKQRKKGVVPMPSAREAARESHGGHAMLAVGYSDVDRLFIVRNSWGRSWGDEGYCYIPYDYLINEEFNDGDSWAIRQLKNIDFDVSSCWSETDESVVGDYESELANMTDEDYETMLDAMGDHPLEYRIALLFLYAAQADDELSDEEHGAIADYMTSTLEALGVEMSAKKILRNALKHVDDTDLIEESVALMGEHLSTEMLAKILSDLESVIGVDGLSEGEADFLYELVEPWQIDSEEEEEEGGEEVDEAAVYAQLEAWAEESDQELNWRESVVDLFKLLELKHTAAARREMAEYLGCPKKKLADSAQMNTWLYQAIIDGLVENGGDIPEDWYE